MKKLAGAALLFFVVSCNHGNDFLTAAPDLAPALDLAELPDMSMAPGPSCGQIAMCAIGCGMDPTCYGGCVMGADPQTLLAVGGLVVCAGTNCLGGLGGGGDGGMMMIDQGQLLMCLLQKCQQQLTMCSGLFGGL